MKKKILLSALSLVLLALPWQGLPGYTLLFAFVPLLLLTGQPGKNWPWILATFALWSAASVWWVGNAARFMFGSPLMGLGISLACIAVTTFVVFWPFAAYLYLRTRAPRALAYTVLVAAWVGYEFIFLHGEITFPWLILGNGFANSVEAVQWFEYTGALGGSVWVWVCNLAAFEAIRAKKSWLRPVLCAGIPLVLSLTLFFTYKEKENPITVQVIQPNFDPYEKFGTLSFRQQTEIILAQAMEAPADVDWFVAPETAIDEQLAEATIETDPYIELMRHLLRERYPDAALVIGATTRGATHLYNAALRIDTAQPVGIYHKSKLVAGAEMVPYAETFPWLRELSMDLGGTSGILGTDPERNVFTSPSGVSIGTPICWEAVFGEYTTGFVKKGAQALFIISNDAWWGRTAGYRQLFAFSRLRAIETRRSIARSANTGLSGFIDQRGRITGKTAWDERVSMTGTIVLNDRITLYVRFGDVIGRIAVFVFILSALYYIAWQRKKKDLLLSFP